METTDLVKAKDYNFISDEEYCRITNCTSSMYMSIDIPIRDVQEYLVRRGYDIIVHKAQATIHEVEMDGGEVNRTGKTWEDQRERILAVKPNTELPKRVDSKEASEMDLRSVFRREFMASLLGFESKTK